MKKSKLSIGLVTSFIAAMAMSACSSDVTKKDGALVTFTPYGSDSAKTVLTQSMYDKYMETSAGISKMYESILEVLIRYDFQKNSEGLSETRESLGSIQSKADNDVKAEKTKAKENAKSNGTSYETEWEAILESYNVETTKELKELFVYKREKSEMQDWYFEENEESLKKEYLGVKADGSAVTPATDAYGDLTSKFPYHIRHILVKNEDGPSNFNTGTVSKDQALNIVKVVSKLADGKADQTFGRIALENSEDSSGSKYGDVGIVTNNATSDGSLTMVPEFQLGIYAYDAVLSGKTNATIEAGLGINGVYEETGESVAQTIRGDIFNGSHGNNTISGLVEVPYNVFDDLKEYADITTDAKGQKVLNTDQESVVYPRNILWNKYLNHHNPFIITNRNRTRIDDLTTVSTASADILETGYDTTTVDTYGTKKCGFASAYKLGLVSNPNTDMKVLTDENDNVIIGVRSQYGIHFTVIQKSIYDFANTDVSLEDYYTTKIPGKEGYPVDAEGNAKLTYVNYMKEGQSDYQTRADQVKDAVKSFDTTYDYRLYEYLVGKYSDNLTFNQYNGQSMDDLIDSYIKLQREKNALTQEEGMNKAWESYFDLLAQQDVERNNSKRMVPEGCAIGFKKTAAGDGSEYEKEGKCYYGK